MKLDVMLKRARLQMLFDARQYMFGVLATQLENVEDPNVDTACTNGEIIRWNPKWVASLSPEERVAVYIHEISHVALGHCWRMGRRDPYLWNVAGDMAINHHIKNLPIHAIMPTPECVDKSAEEIYEILQRKNKGASTAGAAGKDPGKCGMVEPARVEKADQLATQWKVAIAQAAAAQASMGSGSGGLIAQITKTQAYIPWTRVLAEFVASAAKNDYTFAHPNARHFQRGIIMPTLRSNEIKEIVWVHDTSGSITDSHLSRFIAELESVLLQYDTKITVIDCDTDVRHVRELTRNDLPLKIDKLYGRGGTDFRPAFRWVQERGIDPSCLLYLTDGEGTFPTDIPPYPVLWIMTGDHTPPWGRHIRMP